MDIENSIIGFLREIISDGNTLMFLPRNTEFSSLNMDSIDYVRLIVKIEEYFSIEFEDEALDASLFNTLGDLYEYINIRLSTVDKGNMVL